MLVAQLCPTICDPLDYSPLRSSVHGILQARMLQWLVIPFSRGSFWPSDQAWGLLHCGQILYLLSHLGSNGLLMLFKNMCLKISKYLILISNMGNIDRPHLNQRSLASSEIFKSMKGIKTKMFGNHWASCSPGSKREPENFSDLPKVMTILWESQVPEQILWFLVQCFFHYKM